MATVTEAMESLRAGIDALVGIDPCSMGDGESVVELHRQLERLGAVATRAVGAFDASKEWAAAGARSASAWVAASTRTPASAARRRLGTARDLRHMPAAEQAWLAGDIGVAHVEVLARARTEGTKECFADDEKELVAEAADASFWAFCKTVAYWRQEADPDGVDDDAEELHDGRRLHLSETFMGNWRLDADLDPISGTVVHNQLQKIYDELFEVDWAEAKERLGEGFSAADLCRTAAQRRADALVEMARRAGAMAPGSRLPEPLFTVLVGYEPFKGRICQLASGRVVAPGSLVRWLDDAWVETVIFDGPDRPINVKVRQRLFTGATRRAIEVRDRQCFHWTCEIPYERCQADHVEPYSAGGLTTVENGRMACGAHNRGRHRRPEPPG